MGVLARLLSQLVYRARVYWVLGNRLVRVAGEAVMYVCRTAPPATGAYSSRKLLPVLLLKLTTTAVALVGVTVRPVGGAQG